MRILLPALVLLATPWAHALRLTDTVKKIQVVRRQYVQGINLAGAEPGWVTFSRPNALGRNRTPAEQRQFETCPGAEALAEMDRQSKSDATSNNRPSDYAIVIPVHSVTRRYRRRLMINGDLATPHGIAALASGDPVRLAAIELVEAFQPGTDGKPGHYLSTAPIVVFPDQLLTHSSEVLRALDDMIPDSQQLHYPVSAESAGIMGAGSPK